jgi:hypothetical protein
MTGTLFPKPLIISAAAKSFAAVIFRGKGNFKTLSAIYGQNRGTITGNNMRDRGKIFPLVRKI